MNLRGWWPIKRIHSQVIQRFFTLRFVHLCQSVGQNLAVKGPFRLINSGSVHIGNSVIIDSSQERPVCIDVGNQAELTIGDQVYINEGVYISANISIKIGNRTLIASDVVIMDDDGHPVSSEGRHDYWPKVPADRLGAPIIIEDNVWIGTRAMILKGVTIGQGSVIAAGAVVTRSIPVKVLAAGVPARVIREI